MPLCKVLISKARQNHNALIRSSGTDFEGLMLQVKKVGEDSYVAIATPPEVDEVWFSPEPLSAHKLATQLFNRHCHSTDFADAMNEQDPDWIKKAKGPYE